MQFFNLFLTFSTGYLLFGIVITSALECWVCHSEFDSKCTDESFDTTQSIFKKNCSEVSTKWDMQEAKNGSAIFCMKHVTENKDKSSKTVYRRCVWPDETISEVKSFRDHKCHKTESYTDFDYTLCICEGNYCNNSKKWKLTSILHMIIPFGFLYSFSFGKVMVN